MRREDFERLLQSVTDQLNLEVKDSSRDHQPRDFENRVRKVLVRFLAHHQLQIDFAPHPHVFPDIVVGEYGIEVKVTTGNSWRSVANSVFESTRSPDVKYVYVLFGKMGGIPEVRYGRYEDCVRHVRTSHVPRFEVEMYPEKSLFDIFGITYSEFSSSTLEEKMRYIRAYARSRLRPGDRLWWLGDEPDSPHSLPIGVRLYMGLPQEEKRKLRAEAALLCPQIVKSSRSRKKYNDAALYLITYRGVLCPQARDLFSAGSVALRANQARGGIYIQRALKDIEDEMREAANTLEDSLFVEYWGVSVPPHRRIEEWLIRADSYADGWKPSEVLFLEHGRRPPASNR